MSSQLDECISLRSSKKALGSKILDESREDSEDIDTHVVIVSAPVLGLSNDETQPQVDTRKNVRLTRHISGREIVKHQVTNTVLFGEC